MQKRDFIWDTGSAVGISVIVGLVFHYSVQDTVKTGVLLFLAGLVVTFSKELWGTRNSAASPGRERKRRRA